MNSSMIIIRSKYIKLLLSNQDSNRNQFFESQMSTKNE